MFYSISHAVNRAGRTRMVRGFSLIELMVSVVIAAILFTLLAGALGRVRTNANRSAAVADLRQVGLVTLLYAADHNGVLPGPGAMGLFPLYSSTEGTGGLAVAIAPYMGLPERDTVVPSNAVAVEQLIAQEFLNRYPESFARPGGGVNLALTPSYMQNLAITPDGRRPFGRQDGGMDMSEAQRSAWRSPLTLDELAQLPGKPSEHWLICGVDQKVKGLTGGWKSRTPAEPLYDGKRIRLYADNSIEFVHANAK